jgi:hypothetical protein
MPLDSNSLREVFQSRQIAISAKWIEAASIRRDTLMAIHAMHPVEIILHPLSNTNAYQNIELADLAGKLEEAIALKDTLMAVHPLTTEEDAEVWNSKIEVLRKASLKINTNIQAKNILSQFKAAIDPLELAVGGASIANDILHGGNVLGSFGKIIKKMPMPSRIAGVGPAEELPIDLITNYPKILTTTHTEFELKALKDRSFRRAAKLTVPRDLTFNTGKKLIKSIFSVPKTRPLSDGNEWSEENQFTLSVADEQDRQAATAALPVTEAGEWSRNNLYSSKYADQNKSLASKILKFTIQAQHITSNNLEIFPAYIKSFNESIQVDWTPINFIGRSEPLVVYGSTRRQYSLDFMLFVDSGDTPNSPQISASPLYDEIKKSSLSLSSMYSLIEFLHACTRPRYNGTSFAASPILKLTLGDFIKDQTCIIDTLNVSYDPLIWDMQTSVAPRFAHINMTGMFFGAKTGDNRDTMPRADLTNSRFYSI